MTNLNREPIGPFNAPARGWDGQEPARTELADMLMEDDPGIYQDLLAERDEAMERLAAAQRSAREMHIAADNAIRERDGLRAEVEHWRDACGVDHVQRVKRLEAEIEQLRQERSDADHLSELERVAANTWRENHAAAVARAEAADAEVERLKVALGQALLYQEDRLYHDATSVIRKALGS